jgi:uncharacterized Ntn-hydrolase superfamily protein
MTYSIAARCSDTGAFGIAITSSSICVASRCAWVSPYGVIATQNVTYPNMGPAGLALLQQGVGSGGVLKTLLEGTPQPGWRQLGVIDRYGQTTLHSGTQALPIAAEARGEDCFVLGNLLSNPDIPERMVAVYMEAEGASLPIRLLLALEAGKAAGGEGGPEHAAGLHVAEAFDWPTVDLRVDWHDEPIAELRRLWGMYEPQKTDYIARAKNPGMVPDF